MIPTYEGGTPNATSKDFYEHIVDMANDFRVSKATFQNVQFAVFGLGDTVYGENFCAVARQIDEGIAKLGGHRILARGSGDAQYTTDQFEAWLSRLWPSVLAGLGMKDKLAELRAQRRAQRDKKSRPASSKKTAEEEEEEEDNAGEPVADLEDLGKAATGGDDDEESDEEDEEEESEPAEGPKRTLLTPQLSNALTKQGYQLIGSHSGVKLCRWTKAMLRGRGGCYKHTFYNITSYQCMEMTPSLACANKCVFCWRHHKNPVAKEWKWQMDPPELLISQALEKHRAMMRECRGVAGAIPERVEEAQTVRHCALSLVGEPIIYPEINRFLELLHEQEISSFMVTNAQFPEAIDNLRPVTQMYLSIDAGTPESLKKIDRPVFPDFWERFLASIDALRRKQQRTVFRLTLVKQWNMEEMDGYANLIKRGMPDFIEVKGVTYCGNNKASSLTIKNTPYHDEVEEWVRRLCDVANKAVGEGTYELACEHQHSVCFLIANKKKFFVNGQWMTWIDYNRFHELIKEGKPFSATDYMAPTASWALVGSKERGFDPEEQRFRRKGKDGKVVAEEYANQGC